MVDNNVLQEKVAGGAVVPVKIRPFWEASLLLETLPLLEILQLLLLLLILLTDFDDVFKMDTPPATPSLGTEILRIILAGASWGLLWLTMCFWIFGGEGFDDTDTDAAVDDDDNDDDVDEGTLWIFGGVFDDFDGLENFGCNSGTDDCPHTGSKCFVWETQKEKIV